MLRDEKVVHLMTEASHPDRNRFVRKYCRIGVAFIFMIQIISMKEHIHSIK